MNTELADLALDALVNAHATTIIVDSDLFEPVRDLARLALPQPFDELLRCSLCTGTWVGLAQGRLRNRHPLRAFTYGLAVACLGRMIRAAVDLAEDFQEAHPTA